MLAWQVGARLTFPNNVYVQLAPTIYNYTGNGDTFNKHFPGRISPERQSGVAIKLALTACWFSICQRKSAGNSGTCHARLR